MNAISPLHVALLVAGAFFTAGAAMLPAPLFWGSAILAVLTAIVLVVVVLVGASRRSARAPAPAFSPLKSELDANLAGQDPKPGHESAVSTDSRHPTPPQGDVVGYYDPETGVRASFPFYGARKLTVGGVTTARREVEVQGWPTNRIELEQAAADAIKGGTGVVRMTAEGPKRIDPQALTADAMQENRNRYWAERAEQLLEHGGGMPELFKETLEAAMAPAGRVVDEAKRLAQEIDDGTPGVPLLEFSERRPAAVTTDSAMALIQAHRGHASANAHALVELVKHQDEALSKLRGRVVGQIGMALAGQGAASEREADGELAALPLQEQLREAGPAEVWEALRALGWVMVLPLKRPGEVERLWTAPMGGHFGRANETHG